MIQDTVNEVLNGIPAHRADPFRSALKESASLRASIAVATVTVGVVLALAKSLESDQVFSENCELIHDVAVKAHGARIGEFVVEMVEADIRALQLPDAEREVIHDLVPLSSQQMRLQQVLAVLKHLMA
jgi:hypothetical protein